MRKVVVVGVAALVLTIPVAADDKSKAQLDAQKPMRVEIVRSAAPECQPDCPRWISAEGKIGKETPALFRKAIKRLGGAKIPVLVSSPGGNIDAGIEIGRQIRAAKLDVIVARTTIEDCAGTDKDCLRDANKDGLKAAPAREVPFCASACTIMLAAGEKRETEGRPAYVGVHQGQASGTLTRTLRRFRVSYQIVGGRKIETGRTLESEEVVATKPFQRGLTEAEYKRIAAYFKEMGMAGNLVDLMRSTPFESIRWLTPAELLDTRIVNAETTPARLYRRLALNAPDADPPPEDPVARADYMKRLREWVAKARAIRDAAAQKAAEESAKSAAALAAATAPIKIPLGLRDDRPWAMTLSLAADPAAAEVRAEFRVFAGGAPAPTLATAAYVDLPDNRTFAALNGDSQKPDGPLGVSIPRTLLCGVAVGAPVKARLETHDEKTRESIEFSSELPSLRIQPSVARFCPN